jgi:hypothetical protein
LPEKVFPSRKTQNQNPAEQNPRKSGNESKSFSWRQPGLLNGLGLESIKRPRFFGAVLIIEQSTEVKQHTAPTAHSLGAVKQP